MLAWSMKNRLKETLSLVPESQCYKHEYKLILANAE